MITQDATRAPRSRPPVEPGSRDDERRRLRPASRGLAVGSLLAAVAAVAVVLLGGGRPYTLHARFLDAGQLVPGGAVEVAGRSVGSIEAVSVTSDGLADVALAIEDERYVPLHVGTRAAIRAVGAVGVTNRYVDLLPGPQSTAALPHGAVLGTDRTTGIVNVDELLNAFTPSARASVRTLIARGSEVFAGSGSRWFNGVLADLDPALEQAAGAGDELADDHAELERLIAGAAVAARALDSRRTDLESAVADTARALAAVARERDALSDTLEMAPEVLRRADPTLAQTAATLTALRPGLRRIPAVMRELTPVLRELAPTARRLRPLTDRGRRLLPPLNAALQGLPALAPDAATALNSSTAALRRMMHVLRGLRYYGTDLVSAILGLGASTAGPYNENGHYMRVQLTARAVAFDRLLKPLRPLLGLLGLKGFTSLAPVASLPGLSGTRRAIAPCPGGAAPPAPDGSNPWLPAEGICDPRDDRR